MARWRKLIVGVVVLGVLLAGVWIWRRQQPRSAAEIENLLLDGRLLLSQRHYDQAEALAAQVRPQEPLFDEAQLLAGEAATRDERLQDARLHFDCVPRNGSKNALLAARSQAEVCRELGLISEAEVQYRAVLEQQPENTFAHQRLAYLLGVTGRKWDALPQYLFLIQSGGISLDELCLVGDLERSFEEEELLTRWFRLAPHDAQVQLGLAVDAAMKGNGAAALRDLESVVRKLPELGAAQAWLGETLLEARQWDRWRTWHSQLSATTHDHPDVWFVRGLAARSLGRLDMAARCFGETLWIVPQHRRATYQLSQVLVTLRDQAGADFVAQAQRQFELTHELDLVLKAKTKQNEQVFERIVAHLEASGRQWEAIAWARQAISMSPATEWPQQVIQRLTPKLLPDTPLVAASNNLAIKHDLRRYPLPGDLFQVEPSNTTGTIRPSESEAIQFDIAECGIDFIYESGADPQTKGARMFEQTGGSATVIDIDQDDVPDVFFSQGMEWPTGSGLPVFKPQWQDRLFRNVENRAVDVSGLALPEDRGFGQGAAVGDFNNDGFSDLYVANIGRNQLLLNNGDGTFSDVTASAGISGETWTSSCVIVDLNADSLPDLFDVTYVTGPGVYSHICNGRACSPKGFEGVPDRVWINCGDGRFEPARQPLPAEGSKGLGVVAFRMSTSERPLLFIANDQVPNFFLKHEPTDHSVDVNLVNEGFVRGLAFNEHGLAMAGMGIAADDVNGDGRLDFLVTNFKDEPNTLYLQDANGLFADSTRAAGLHAPSLPFVSWGTQFLDADLDGDSDLVVVSGHVDDYRDAGGDWHMRPQFFRNNGRGQFDELRGSQVGPYFDRLYLGRGLSRLDWDQDGRPDFVVSNVGASAVLAVNRSRTSGHFVKVLLRATTTARDAIGTIVTVTGGPRRHAWTKQLVAGDGYMASNERGLHFGLGAVDVIDEVRVVWPSGKTTRLRNVPSDSTLTLIEGAFTGTLRRGASWQHVETVSERDND